MRAVVYEKPQDISSDTALIDVERPMPEATGHDLLVEIKAVSVNPVDTKVRRNREPAAGGMVQLGWDAAGIVKSVGKAVTLFRPGDEVYYAGVINRDGTNAEYHLVDERIVGRKPSSLSFREAAALPLTAITAYEMIFDRLKVEDEVPGDHGAILIIGGAGGVGSIAVQLARQLTRLTVIATASRPESADWVKSLGAHHVINHSQPLAPQVAALGIVPGYIFPTTHSDEHLAAMAEIVAPQGRIGLIDDPAEFSIKPFKQKAVSIHWEFMFTRGVFGTEDMLEQHNLLNQVADLVDAGKIRTTAAESFGTINAENLRRAHRQVESHSTIGKVVLEGF
ncbi:MAG: zinc-binding alcohol dehydrogenase family protein [Rhizobium sp.]|nr:zinc-binding alcohol dehydrogenase family protein [Rhizobium sp.]